MSRQSRRKPFKSNRTNVFWLAVFIFFSVTAAGHMGWYWMGTILGAYLMLAFASVLLKGRRED